MERMKNMKNNNIMEKLYVGMDIHEKYITGTAMRKDGTIDFGGTFPNTEKAAQCFLGSVPSPQVKIAIEYFSLPLSPLTHFPQPIYLCL